MSTVRILLSCVVLLTLTGSLAIAQKSNPLSEKNTDKLHEVLERLDRTAAEFHSAEASFEWDQYQRVTDETDKQKGKVYFRRTSGGMQMAADVTDPSPMKKVLFTGGKVQLYQASTDQLDVYDAGKSTGSVESFLVLGFGGSGKDMVKSFDISYGGSEKIDGVDTDRLELIPRAEKVRGMFSRIELWIDSRGISIQQKLITPEADYRLNRYSEVVLNHKIMDAAFKLKLTGKTKIENH